MDPYSSDRTDRTTPEKNSPTDEDARTQRESVFTDSPVDISETEGDCVSKNGEQEGDEKTTPKKARTDENTNDTKIDEKCPQMKRSASMLRFDKWNVGERYHLTRVLGQGSYGEVAEAWDTA